MKYDTIYRTVICFRQNILTGDYMQSMGESSKLGKIIYDYCGGELCQKLELRGVEVDRESRCINAYFISEGARAYNRR